jgi:hypothetical protein
MAALPLIQPSSSVAKFGASTAKRSIFSAPTVDINDPSTEQDLLKEQDVDDNSIPNLHLDPSPIGKGTSVGSWAKSNRTIGATFRPCTNEIAVFVAGKKAAEDVCLQFSLSHCLQGVHQNHESNYSKLTDNPPFLIPVSDQAAKFNKGQHRVPMSGVYP